MSNEEDETSMVYQEPETFPSHMDNLPPNLDNSQDFPYIGQTFSCDSEAYDFYIIFAKKRGFSVRHERSLGNTNHPLGFYRREYVCHRAGCAKPEKDNEVRFLPAYREIQVPNQKRILVLSKTGCTVNLIMRVLELEKGIDPGHLPFTEKDIRNFIQSQAYVGKENDASELLKLCKSLKDEDADFNYDFTIDENQKLEHIIWSFGDSIRAYEVFGDAVVFDTTYRINRYDMPLGVWVGVNNHGNSIFFG